MTINPISHPADKIVQEEFGGAYAPVVTAVSKVALTQQLMQYVLAVK